MNRMHKVFIATGFLSLVIGVVIAFGLKGYSIEQLLKAVVLCIAAIIVSVLFTFVKKSIKQSYDNNKLKEGEEKNGYEYE